MAREPGTPIILKRKKVSGEGGHHGGAWKVAMALVLFGGGAFCAEVS